MSPGDLGRISNPTKPNSDRKRLDRALAIFKTLPVEERERIVARLYARLIARLEAAGTPHARD